MAEEHASAACVRSGLDELQAHLVRSACTDVIMRYATYVDSGSWDEFFALWDDHWDGTLPQPMIQPHLVVGYRTAFRRGPHGWRILRHDATHVFRSEI